jgi:hypothetical protein
MRPRTSYSGVSVHSNISHRTDAKLMGKSNTVTRKLSAIRSRRHIDTMKPWPAFFLALAFHNIIGILILSIVEMVKAPISAPTYLTDHGDGPLARGMRTSPLRNCGSPCVLNYSGGGFNIDFEIASLIINYWPEQHLIINGPCISACTILADLSFNKTCITDNASFYYHKSSMETISYGYSRYVLDWIAQHGGFPDFRSGKTLQMSREAVHKHWRSCSSLDLENVRNRSFPQWLGLTAGENHLVLFPDRLYAGSEQEFWEERGISEASQIPLYYSYSSYICGPCNFLFVME